jgi:hypothetical protein
MQEGKNNGGLLAPMRQTNLLINSYSLTSTRAAKNAKDWLMNYDYYLAEQTKTTQGTLPALYLALMVYPLFARDCS